MHRLLSLLGKSHIGKRATRRLVCMVCCVVMVAGLVGPTAASDPQRPGNMLDPTYSQITQKPARLTGPSLNGSGVVETVLLCENFDSGPGGWFPLDVDLARYPTMHYWHLDPAITPDNGAWSLSATDPCYVISPGYGNYWNMYLDKSFPASGGDPLSGWVDVTYQIDTEAGFDFFYVEVRPDNATEWVTLHTESGINLSGATGMLNFGPFAGASSVTVRIRFESDNAFSQEDGSVPTTIGRAVVIDDVTVSVSAGGPPVVTSDDFTTGEEGWTPGLMPLGPTLATFRLEPDPDCTPAQYLLDMGITELECDHPAPCAPAAATNYAWTSTDPATGVVAEIPADYDRVFTPGIQSPVIPMAPSAGTEEYLIEYDIFSDQLFENTRMVYQYDFAFTSGGNPCPPKFVKSFSWKSHGPAVGWVKRSFSFTQYVPPAADGVIVRLNIGDWVNVANAAPGLGGRGRGAYFDNVRIIRLTAPPGPPVLECQETVRISATSCEVLVPEIGIDHEAIRLVLDDLTERDQLTVNQVPAAGTPATLPFDVTLSVTDLDGNTSNTCTVTFYDNGCACDPVAPILTCPGPITVECAGLCGTPADDPQLAEWFASLSIIDCDLDPDISNDAPACFPLGTTTVTWTVTDGNGNASQCSSDVTVVDNTAPDITVDLNRYVLWPPNHKMADIHATVEATDACCDNPTFRLVSVTSNEPDNGKGDGNTINDIVIVSDTHIQLRSERSGKGEGRIYTLTYEVEDCAGNTTLGVAEVRVPHDHDGWACASTGFGTATLGFEPAVDRFALVIRSTPAEYETGADGSQMLIREAFDARAIDLSQAYVGNLKGVVMPEETMEIDNNGDGLKDMALFYPAGAVNMLIVESTPTDDGRIDDDTDYGTLGLHYTGMDGVDYLVPNIFALGPPVPLVPEIQIGRSGSDPGDENGGMDAIPKVTALLSAYPNPFNPTTTIPFTLESPGHVAVRVYDAGGRLVRTLSDESMPAGRHSVSWNGRDNAGRQAATGVYFVHMRAGSYEATKKIVLIK